MHGAFHLPSLEEGCGGNSVTSTTSNNNLSGPSNVSHASANLSQSLTSSSGLPLFRTSSTCRTFRWGDEGT
ncbi:hypothetical protein C350_05067 [Cryptococcus neoformans MW-RSA36]|nr:hypothetical protein C350_05067 [Cryptococcus neoformans var. grubii MW-RSA36]